MSFIKDKLFFFIGIIDIISSIFAMKVITKGDLLIVKPFAGFILIGGIVLIIMSLFKSEN